MSNERSRVWKSGKAYYTSSIEVARLYCEPKREGERLSRCPPPSWLKRRMVDSSSNTALSEAMLPPSVTFLFGGMLHCLWFCWAIWYKHLGAFLIKLNAICNRVKQMVHSFYLVIQCHPCYLRDNFILENIKTSTLFKLLTIQSIQFVLLPAFNKNVNELLTFCPK